MGWHAKYMEEGQGRHGRQKCLLRRLLTGTKRKSSSLKRMPDSKSQENRRKGVKNGAEIGRRKW